MLREVETALLVNKDGRGDKSGTLPPEALDDICAYFIGGHERLAAHREAMKERLQERYGSGVGASSHDIGWLFRAVYDRKPVPQELTATITCPVLILRGADDRVVCPVEACEQWARSVFVFPRSSSSPLS